MIKGWLNCILFLVLFLNVTCRKAYEPPEIKSGPHFLSIDGLINMGANSSSTFILSRSLNLSDSFALIPELNAQVMINSLGGEVYTLYDPGGAGFYDSGPLTLDPGQKYYLSVVTSDRHVYMSDTVTPKKAPQIDSISWQLQTDHTTGQGAVKIFANAHDETNNTRYYRWDYDETWQHQSYYETIWGLKDGLEYPIDPSESTHNCWTTLHSTSIILASSVNLSEDVISQAELVNFAKDDPRLDIKYSILVRQYPLDPDAYTYWLTVQKNSQSLGGLFDIQPSGINGNIHCISNPGDRVAGFVSASTIEEKRIFISNTSLPEWNSHSGSSCPVLSSPSDPTNSLIWNYPDTSTELYYFSSSFPPNLKISYKSCLDCRYQGGVTVKPPFWQ